MKIKVKRWRISGNVIIVRVENEMMKREVMKNKKELKEKDIFLRMIGHGRRGKFRKKLTYR